LTFDIFAMSFYVSLFVIFAFLYPTTLIILWLIEHTYAHTDEQTYSNTDYLSFNSLSITRMKVAQVQCCIGLLSHVSLHHSDERAMNINVIAHTKIFITRPSEGWRQMLSACCMMPIVTSSNCGARAVSVWTCDLKTH